MPQRNTGSLTATGQVVIQPDQNDAEVRVTLTGTYTGVQGKIQGSLDGVTYVDLAQVREDTGASVTGKVNASAANLSIVARIRGWPFVQFNLTDYSSGTVAVDVRSAANFGYATLPVAVAAQTIASNSANALAVGPNGTTNPTLQVDGSAASAATGVKVTAAAAGSGVAVGVISSGTNEALSLDAKGSGQTIIGGTSTGLIILGRGAAKGVVEGLTKTDVNSQNAAPTAAQWLGGYITHNSQTGAGTLTTPTGANLDAGISGVATGDSFMAVYQNRGNQTVTLTAGDGNVTIKGTAAIPTLKTSVILFTRTGSGTWDACQILSA